MSYGPRQTSSYQAGKCIICKAYTNTFINYSNYRGKTLVGLTVNIPVCDKHYDQIAGNEHFTSFVELQNGILELLIKED